MSETARSVRYLLARVKGDEVEPFKPMHPRDPETLVVGGYAAAVDGDAILVVAKGRAGRELLELVRDWGGEPQNASRPTEDETA